jgi:hypothetical protein
LTTGSDISASATRVGNYRAVFQQLEVPGVNDVTVAGYGNEYVTLGGSLLDGHHTEAVHYRFDGSDRIDLGDDHVGAHAASAHGHAASAPAVADHDEGAAGQQDVSGPDHPV